MIDIRGLAYFVAQIDDLAEWKHYAENVLGMMTSAAPGGGLYVKMDERPFRILVVQGDERRYVASGWELAGEVAFKAALAENRAQFYLDIPSGPFYGFNREGATVSEGLIQNWWRQGMSGSAKAQLDTITAFSETDFTEDLKAISVPVLVMHGEDDQIVPVDETARRAVKLLQNGTLKTYEGLPHGLFATNPDMINADLLAFIEG